jgi:molecular chaperone GrpE
MSRGIACHVADIAAPCRRALENTMMWRKDKMNAGASQDPRVEPTLDAVAPDAVPAAETTAPAEGDTAAALDAVGALEASLAEANAKVAEYYDGMLRAKAETDNARRRATEDVSKAHKFGIEKFAEAMLPVIDSLTAALADPTSDVAKLREGVELTKKQLTGALERNRLVSFDPVGEKFDPHRHQAISTVPAPAGTPPNHVVTTLQQGWMLADRVLRPALVTVSA